LFGGRLDFMFNKSQAEIKNSIKESLISSYGHALTEEGLNSRTELVSAVYENRVNGLVGMARTF
jgi:hypothetical protein